jgi:hypothetical protein
LETVLDQARDFANAHDLGSWSSRFAGTLATAGTNDPEIPYNPGLALEGALDHRQRQLLAAAV